MNIRVTIWNEYRHEREDPHVRQIYPRGIHQYLAEQLAAPDLEIRTATLDEPEHGLTADVVTNTDVMLWWGHAVHDKVSDEIVRRVQDRVWEGMGLVCLHSAHFSKIFRALNGTNCKLHWRDIGEKERIWKVDPSHPIAQGLPDYFELPHEEMYGEPFIVAPDAHVVFISWFEGGEVFRSGVSMQRGNGRIFYFRPGHEAYPSYYNEHVIKVIANAIRWARPVVSQPYPKMHAPVPLENISSQPS